MLLNIAVSAAYFYFNWRYFALLTAVLKLPRMPKLPVVGTFLLNYALFYLCSALELNLVVNWAFFFLFYFGETLLYGKIGWHISFYLSLYGTLYGLTANNFCRCAVAIVFSQPLVAFNNHISNIGNLKALPVFLGFLLGGALLHWMSLPKSLERHRTLIAHPQHLGFHLELMTGMFLYLSLNLLLYQSASNGVLLKLWGVKSSVFSLVGSHLGLRYSLKMCRLSDYREQNRLMRRELAQSELEERQLRSIAYRDLLTGVYNRQYALEQLEQLIQQQTPFALCFLDLDDLKGVNDRYGHAEGDRYLAAAAQELARVCRTDCDILARYGGDEFLILFPGSDAAHAEACVQQADLRLQALSRQGAVPFPMSLSYGAVDCGDETHTEALLAAADTRMYQRKRSRSHEKR